MSRNHVRRLAVCLGVVLVILAGVLVLNRSTAKQDAAEPARGLDEVKLACYDVRTVAAAVQGDHVNLGTAVAVLDLAIQLSHHAASVSQAWTPLDASLTKTHSAAHAGDYAAVSQGMQDTLTACQDIPDPVIPGS